MTREKLANFYKLLVEICIPRTMSHLTMLQDTEALNILVLVEFSTQSACPEIVRYLTQSNKRIPVSKETKAALSNRQDECEHSRDTSIWPYSPVIKL